MTHVLNSIRTAARRHAAYRRTVSELRNLPSDLAKEDLGLYPGDAHAIAHRAVYGR